MKITAGIDTEFGIVAVAKTTRKGTSIEVIRSTPKFSLEELMEQAGVKPRQAVIGLGGPGVFLRMMKVPGDLDEKGISETVKWQFVDVIPDRIIKHFVTGKMNNQWYVLVGGVLKEAVTGSKIGILDLRIAALWRGALHYLNKEPNTPIAVIEKTTSGYRVAAGRSFLEVVREIPSDSESELQRTLIYCRTEISDDIQIFYVGKELPEETTAVGLALHHVSAPRLNFLIKEKRQLPSFPAGKQLLKIAAAGTLLALLPYIAIYSYDRQIKEYDYKVLEFQPAVEKVTKLRAEREKYQDWAAIVESFKVEPIYPLMKDIRNAIPKSCWFTSITTEYQEKETDKKKPASKAAELLPKRANLITFEGYSLDAASVGLFKDNILKYEWAENVLSLSIKWDDQIKAYLFTMKVSIKNS